MIAVEHLTKYYGEYPAVRDVSFNVDKGQVVGFLGPNGAGKSTTMRILAGYLTASSGKATIDGKDVFWNPIEARRRIGYMPESCPLYSRNASRRIPLVPRGLEGPRPQAAQTTHRLRLERCWVNDVRRQPIGTLSKGYRQRVGLADALLADPPVLDSRRTDRRPRSDADSRDPAAAPRTRPPAHHAALHAHPQRSGDDLRFGHHHLPGEGRGGRLARPRFGSATRTRAWKTSSFA